jgi:hypothetical protein
MFGRPSGSPFAREDGDAAREAVQGRANEGEVSKEGLNGGEPLIARGYAVPSASAGVFQVLKEGQEGFWVEVLDEKPGFPWGAGAKKSEEDFEPIAIAFDGVGA